MDEHPWRSDAPTSKRILDAGWRVCPIRGQVATRRIREGMFKRSMYIAITKLRLCCFSFILEGAAYDFGILCVFVYKENGEEIIYFFM